MDRLACSRQEADVAIETQGIVETLIDDVRAVIRGAPDPDQPPLEPIKAAIECADRGSRDGYAEVLEIQRVMAEHGGVTCMPKGIARETLSAGDTPALNLIIRGLKRCRQHVYDPAGRF
jgi:hypothetical protein